MNATQYDPRIHHRRSIRLKEYDYSMAGAYHIVICSYQSEQLFGTITNGIMIENEFGKIVVEEWLKSGQMRAEIELDVFQIMPDHFHAIVFIKDNPCGGANGRSPVTGEGEKEGKEIPAVSGGANGRSPVTGKCICPPMRPKSISSLMAGFKGPVKIRINQLRNTPGRTVWHRNYYDHIIRNENELYRVREYIKNNPAKWKQDSNPDDPIKY